MKILLFSGMSDKKLISKIEPILSFNYVDSLYIVRNQNLIFNKVISYSTPSLLKSNLVLREIYRLFKAIILLMFNKVSIVYGIYLTMHGIYAFILGKIFRKPIIQNIIGTDTPKILKSKILQKIIINSDIIIVRGNKAKVDFIRFGTREDKIYNIPNHYNFPKLNLNIHNTTYDLIYVGAFNNIKRLDILINAVHLVKIKFDLDIKVCLVGDGELKEKYKNLIIEKKLENNFTFVGEQKEVETYLQRSKAFIMTSEFEGLPQAMIEALACGLPVIMPNISNIPDYAVEGYNALLVEPLDVEGFADAIYKLMTDDELYKKLKAGAEKFRDEHEYEFSIENITNIWNQIFKQLGLIVKDNAK